MGFPTWLKRLLVPFLAILLTLSACDGKWDGDDKVTVHAGAHLYPTGSSDASCGTVSGDHAALPLKWYVNDDAKKQDQEHTEALLFKVADLGNPHLGSEEIGPVCGGHEKEIWVRVKDTNFKPKPQPKK